MNTLLIVVATTALLGPVKTEAVWQIDRPLIEIVDGLLLRSDKIDQQLPQLLLEVADKFHVAAEFKALPGEHYYRFAFEFNTLGGRLSGRKTLEVWGRQPSVFRSTVELTILWDGPLLRLIGRGVSGRLLEFERSEIARICQP